MNRIILPFFLIFSGACHAQPLDGDDIFTYLESVYTSSPVIDQQRLLYQASEHGIGAARSARLPTLSLGLRGDSSLTNKVSFRFSLPLYTFGKIQSDIDLKVAEADLEKLKLLQVINNTLYTAAEDYIEYHALLIRYSTYSAQEAKLTLLEARVERRNRAGIDSDVEVQLVRTKLLNTKTEVEALRQQIVAVQLKLERNNGAKLGQLAPLPDLFRGLVDLDPESIIDSSNPDILLAKARISSLEAEENRMRLTNRPTLSLSAIQEYSTLSESLNTAGLNLDYNLDGLGFRLRDQSRQAEVRTASAKAALRNSQYDVKLDADTQIARIVHLEQQMALQRTMLESYQATIDSYLRQLDAGSKSLMELLSIYSDHLSEQLKLVDNQAMILKSKNALFKQFGGYWTMFETEEIQ